MNALKLTTNSEALELYNRFFPGFKPSPFQQDLVTETVKDMSVWKDVLTYWAGNDYRAQSIKKMLDYYEELKSKKGSRYEVKQIKSQVGLHSVPYVPEPPCEYCGAEYCMKTHREERGL